MEWLLVPDRLIWVFQKLLIYWDFHAQPSLGFTENVQWAAVVWTKMPYWCQRRMDRRVRDDRKATITQINTHCNQGLQNTISERTTRAVVKSTFVESKTSPSPKRFESESSPSPKRFESESSPSPKRFESESSPSPKRFESKSKSKWDGQNRERKKSSSKPHT